MSFKPGLIEATYGGRVVAPSGRTQYELPQVRATSRWDAERQFTNYVRTTGAVEGWKIEVWIA